jgi:hypothetical protein
MKRLRLVVFLVLVAACQGLGGGDSGETAVRYRWELRYAGGARPGTLTCAEADVRGVLFEVRDPASIQDVDREFPCLPGEAVLRAAGPGRFDVFGRLTNSERTTIPPDNENETLFGGTVGNVDIQAGETVELKVVFPLSYFSLEWVIERAGQRITCEEAGASAVRILTTREFVAPRVFEIPCTGGGGVTGVVPATHYNSVDYELVGGDGEVLARDAYKNRLDYPDSFGLRDGTVGTLGRATFKLR